MKDDQQQPQEKKQRLPETTATYESWFKKNTLNACLWKPKASPDRLPTSSASVCAAHAVLWDEALNAASFGLFGPQSRIKRLAYTIVKHKWFEWTIIFLIFLNCVFLAFDGPRKKDAVLSEAVLLQAERIFTLLFGVEMFLKLIALSCEQYFRSAWNVLDFSLVVLSCLPAIWPMFYNYTAIRAFRAIRPMRSFSGVPGLRVIVEGLLASLRGLINVVGLMFFTLFIFAVLGVDLWKGIFRNRCGLQGPVGYNISCDANGNVSGTIGAVNDSIGAVFGSAFIALYESTFNSTFNGTMKEPFSGTLNGTIVVPHQGGELFCMQMDKGGGFPRFLWGQICPAGLACITDPEDPEYGLPSYDHVGWAFLTLLQIITLEGWTDIMYITKDVYGQICVVFYVSAVLIGSFFLLNLALAVIFFNFDHHSKAQSEISLMLSVPEEKKSRCCFLKKSSSVGHTLRRLSSSPPARGLQSKYHAFRKFVQKYVHEGSRFQGFMNLLTLVNTLLLASEHYGQPASLTKFLYYSNFALTGCFLVEMVLKLVAFGSLQRYCKDCFNILDGFVVTYSVVELAIFREDNINYASGVSGLRALRLLRVLKLLRGMTQMRELLKVMFRAVAATQYMFLMLILYLFIAALMGMQFFGDAWEVEDEAKPRANFDSIGWAMLTVFQILTRDDWNSVMWHAMKSKSGPVSCVYFVFLIISGDFVILNLFMAILIKSFESEPGVTAPRARRLNVPRRSSLVYFDIGHNPFESADDEAKGCCFPEKWMCWGSRSGTRWCFKDHASSKSVGAPRNLEEQQSSHGSSRQDKSDPKAPLSACIISGAGPLLHRRASAPAPDLRDGNQGDDDASVCSDNSTCMPFGANPFPWVTPLPGAITGFSGRPRASSLKGMRHNSLKNLQNAAEVQPLRSQWSPAGSRSSSPRAEQESLAHSGLGKWQGDPGLGERVRSIEGLKAVHMRASSALGTQQAESGVSARRQSGVGPRQVTIGSAEDLEELAQVRQSALGGRQGSLGARQNSLGGRQGSLGGCHSGLGPRQHSDRANSNGQPLRQSSLGSVDNSLGKAGRALSTTSTGTVSASGHLAVLGPQPACGRGPRDSSGSRGSAASSSNHSRGSIESAKQSQRGSFGAPWGHYGEAYQFGEHFDTSVDGLDAHPGGDIGGAAVLATEAPILRAFWRRSDMSLLCFKPQSPVRRCCKAVVNHKFFMYFIMGCIVVSCGSLAVENPHHQWAEPWPEVWQWVNITFAFIFGMECMMKIVAYGFYWGPNFAGPEQRPYLKDPWNILDFIIWAMSIVNIFTSSAAFQVARIFRYLRPLRIIRRNSGLQVVVQTLLQAIPSMGNTCGITLLVYLWFGMLAVQFFAGMLHFCSDNRIESREACLAAGAEWVNSQWNFDNVFVSTLTLFEVSTLELWSTIMYNTLDARGVDLAPLPGSNSAHHAILVCLFFVSFVIIVAFFIVNMFVGVMIRNFNVVKKQMSGMMFLTDEQQTWLESEQLMLRFGPLVKPGKPRRCRGIFHLVESTAFKAFIELSICLNMVVLAMDHYPSSPYFDTWYNLVNPIFTLIFLVEAVLTIIAYRTYYFKDSLYRLDFFLVVVSVTSLALDFLFPKFAAPQSLVRIGRLFRVLRVVRVLRVMKSVRRLLETLLFCLPALSNIGAFMFMLIFMYAVLGMNFFGGVKHGEYLNRHANFENVLSSMEVLFRVTTGENWNGIMHDLMIGPEDGCVEYPKSNCGTPLAILYFISFLLITAFIMLNLLIAVILESFLTTMAMDNSALKMGDLNHFREVWAEFDPSGQRVIPTCYLVQLLKKLGPPLGIPQNSTRLQLLRKLHEYQIPEHGGYIHFIETLIPLARHVAKIRLTFKERTKSEERWSRLFPEIQSLPCLMYQGEKAMANQYFAATYISAAFRRAAVTHWTKRKPQLPEGSEKLETDMDVPQSGMSPLSKPLLNPKAVTFFPGDPSAACEGPSTAPPRLDFCEPTRERVQSAISLSFSMGRTNATSPSQSLTTVFSKTLQDSVGSASQEGGAAHSDLPHTAGDCVSSKGTDATNPESKDRQKSWSKSRHRFARTIGAPQAMTFDELLPAQGPPHVETDSDDTKSVDTVGSLGLDSSAAAPQRSPCANARRTSGDPSATQPHLHHPLGNLLHMDLDLICPTDQHEWDREESAAATEEPTLAYPEHAECAQSLHAPGFQHEPPASKMQSVRPSARLTMLNENISLLKGHPLQDAPFEGVSVNPLDQLPSARAKGRVSKLAMPAVDLEQPANMSGGHEGGVAFNSAESCPGSEGEHEGAQGV